MTAIPCIDIQKGFFQASKTPSLQRSRMRTDGCGWVRMRSKGLESIRRVRCVEIRRVWWHYGRVLTQKGCKLTICFRQSYERVLGHLDRILDPRQDGRIQGQGSWAFIGTIGTSHSPCPARGEFADSKSIFFHWRGAARCQGMEGSTRPPPLPSTKAFRSAFCRVRSGSRAEIGNAKLA